MQGKGLILKRHSINAMSLSILFDTLHLNSIRNIFKVFCYNQIGIFGGD